MTPVFGCGEGNSQETGASDVVGPTDTKNKPDATQPAASDVPPNDENETPPSNDTNPGQTSDTSSPASPDSTPSDTNAGDVGEASANDSTDSTPLPPDSTSSSPDAETPTFQCSDLSAVSPIDLGVTQGLTTFEYNNQGQPSEREVYFYLPPDFKPAEKYPVVFGFHGTSGNPQAWNGQLGPWNGKPVIGVFPQGAMKGGTEENPKYSWNTGVGETIENDLDFVRSLWAAIKDNAFVDSENVFASGNSVGSAFVANRIAIDPCVDFLAGFALGSSQMVVDAVIHESLPSRTVVIFHGEDDALIPIDGGEVKFAGLNFLSVEDTLKAWAEHNGCAEGTDQPMVSNDRAGKFTKVEYTECATPVVLYRLIGQAHGLNFGWAGGKGSLLSKIFFDNETP